MLGARALSQEALAGWSQATSEAAHVGEAVTARGRGSPEPPSLAQPRPGQPAPAIWPVCSGLLGCVASALATARLRPGLSCSRGSDPQSHECPRAADLLEAVGSADSNEVFLREEGEGSRSAAGQGESRRTGCVSPEVPPHPRRAPGQGGCSAQNGHRRRRDTTASRMPCLTQQTGQQT